MEVCGTHTMNLARTGLKEALPANIELVSGPGCPVCVTESGYIAALLELAGKGIKVITFGDLIKVPDENGRRLGDLPAGDIFTVYSPDRAFDICDRQGNEFVFAGIGFETTAPLIAFLIKEAKRRKLRNFSVLSAHKRLYPALKLLSSDRELNIDAFLLPGHVTVITGTDYYEGLKIRGTVTGFEYGEMADGITVCLGMISTGFLGIKNAYTKAAGKKGNPAMLRTMNEIFSVCDSEWRGFGMIPGSGYGIRPGYSEYDAALKFGVTVKKQKKKSACICGDILRGRKTPFDCPSFALKCNPRYPIGPCMVSSEGACSAWYKYKKRKN